MDDASEKMHYEKSLIEYRDMINHIESTTEKQIINLKVILKIETRLVFV